jgi:hypothetical protein
MKLIKHTIDEVPPTTKELLMVIDVGTANGYYLWTVGAWNESGWCCPFDNIGYKVIEWYELPQRKNFSKEKEKNTFNEHDLRQLEDFWKNK